MATFENVRKETNKKIVLWLGSVFEDRICFVCETDDEEAGRRALLAFAKLAAPHHVAGAPMAWDVKDSESRYRQPGEKISIYSSFEIFSESRLRELGVI